MRYLAILLFAGCAHTEIRDPKTGVVVFKTYGDSSQIAFSKQGENYEVQAVNLNHSTATRALGSVIGTTGTSFAASGLGAILKP